MQNAFWQSGCGSIWFLNKKQIKKNLMAPEALSLPKLQMSLKKKLFFWSTSLMTQRKIELTYMCPTLFAKI